MLCQHNLSPSGLAALGSIQEPANGQEWTRARRKGCTYIVSASIIVFIDGLNLNGEFRQERTLKHNERDISKDDSEFQRQLYLLCILSQFVSPDSPEWREGGRGERGGE